MGVIRLPLQQRLHSNCVHAPPIPADVLLVVVLLACCCWPIAAAASAALGLLKLSRLVLVKLAVPAPARVSNRNTCGCAAGWLLFAFNNSHQARTPTAWLHTLRPARRPPACPPAAAWTCVPAALAAAPVVMLAAASLPCASLAVVP